MFTVHRAINVVLELVLNAALGVNCLWMHASWYWLQEVLNICTSVQN